MSSQTPTFDFTDDDEGNCLAAFFGADADGLASTLARLQQTSGASDASGTATALVRQVTDKLALLGEPDPFKAFTAQCTRQLSQRDVAAYLQRLIDDCVCQECTAVKATTGAGSLRDARVAAMSTAISGFVNSVLSAAHQCLETSSATVPPSATESLPVFARDCTDYAAVFERLTIKPDIGV